VLATTLSLCALEPTADVCVRGCWAESFPILPSYRTCVPKTPCQHANARSPHRQASCALLQRNRLPCWQSGRARASRSLLAGLAAGNRRLLLEVADGGQLGTEDVGDAGQIASQSVRHVPMAIPATQIP